MNYFLMYTSYCVFVLNVSGCSSCWRENAAIDTDGKNRIGKLSFSVSYFLCFQQLNLL